MSLSNSPTAVQNWLWQAEQFLIWSDGLSLPLFWDGRFLTRSTGANPVLLATTIANFVAPQANQFVQSSDGTITPITIQSAWPESFGTGVVLIGSAQYKVVGFTGGSDTGLVRIILNQITGTGGDYINPGTPVVTTSRYAGTIQSANTVSSLGALTPISTWPPLPNPGISGVTGATLTPLAVLPIASPFPPASLAGGTTMYDAPAYCGVINSASVANFPPAPVPGALTKGVVLSIPSGVAVNSFSGATGQKPYINVAHTTLNIAYPATILTCGTAQLQVTSVQTSNGFVIGVTADVIAATGSAVITATQIRIPPHTQCTGTNVQGNCVQTGTSPGGSFTGSGATLYTPPVPNTFTLTISSNFIGSSGDNLLVGNAPTTTQNVTVQSVSGSVVTCVMPSTSTLIGAAIPLGNTLVQNTTTTGPVINYGTINAALAGSGISVTAGMIAPINNTAQTLSVGQILYFSANVAAGGTETVISIITALSNGNINANPNYFELTLSQAFAGNVGDALQVGTGSYQATFTVTAIVSATVIQAQMSNSPGIGFNTIPIATGTPSLSQIVIDNTPVNPAVIVVGTYPTTTQVPSVVPITVSPTLATTGLQTIASTTSPVVGEIVQIAVSASSGGATSGNDLFQVVGVIGGSTGTSPTVTLENINDTPGTDVPAGTGIYSLPQLPQCRMGVYGMQRNWVAVTDGVSCNSFVASDINGGASGTAFYDYTDAVLYVSDNFFLSNGTTFKINGAGESIVAMAFIAQLNVALGTGPLNIFTDDSVTNCQAPTDATTWANLSSPIITDGLKGSGGIGQNAVVQENADLLFRLSSGGVQSVETASIAFLQWGNTPISNEIIRVIQNDNPALLQFCSIVVFDNRMLMTCQFVQMSRGVVGQALAVLNFDEISTLANKSPSIWEGQWTGLNVLQSVTGRFQSAEHCFCLCLSSDGSTIELSEIFLDGTATVDNGNSSVTWEFETGVVFDPQSKTPESRSYKRLEKGEFSIDEITSDISVSVFYKPDQWPNWVPWYSVDVNYLGSSDPGFRSRIGLGQPDPSAMDKANNRPLRDGYDFQVKFSITGSCRFIAGRFGAIEIPEPTFAQPKQTV